MGDPKSARTIPALVRAMAEAYGDRPAVVLESETLTYRELERRSAVLARGLLARGVGKGSHIGFLFANGPMWVVVWAAIARTGAVAVPLSTLLKGPELASVLKHGDLQGVIAQRSYLKQDVVHNFGVAFPEAVAEQDPSLHLVDAPYLRWIAFEGESLPGWSRAMEWLQSGADETGFDGALLRA